MWFLYDTSFRYFISGVEYGEKISEPTIPKNVIREGCAVIGWRAQESDSFWNFDTDTVTSDMTLIAGDIVVFTL